MFRTIAALAVASCAFGQQLTPSLIEFLDLAAAQITRLRQNAAEFNRFHGEKSQRYQQVTLELQQEIAREVLDPLGLGQRYVEQEAICREMRTAFDQNMAKNLTILTESQKAKLKTMDAIAENARLASSAASENLIEPTGNSFSFSARSGNFIFDPYLGAPSTGVTQTCGVPTVQANPVLTGTAKEVRK